MQFQVVLLLVLGISSALSSPHPDFSVQPGDEAHDHHHEHHHHAHEGHGREDEHDHHEHHHHAHEGHGREDEHDHHDEVSKDWPVKKVTKVFSK